MRRPQRLVTRWLAIFSACLFCPVVHAQPTGPAVSWAEPLRTALDRSFDIRNIRLELRVDLAGKTIEGQATVRILPLRTMQAVSLDAVGFDVQKVNLTPADGPEQPAKFRYDGNRLVVELDPSRPARKEFDLHVSYRIHNPQSGLHFFAPTASDPNVPLCLWSHGEPISSRYWFPCVDHPCQRQSTQMVVTVPQGFDAVSNGRLVSRTEDLGNKTVTFDWQQDQPHPSYLVTLVVGQFEIVREEWNGVPLLYYLPKGFKDEGMRGLGHTKQMLSFFSQRFGLAYPWDKYAQVVPHGFNGGQENTSAATLGEEILRDERSLLDGAPDALVAHELAHQWWGNLITCRDWAHVWLNEGFASYAEALWDEQEHGADAYAYTMWRKSKWAMHARPDRPLVDRRYPSPGIMFDGRSYLKGAWVLHMLRRRLGDEAFWKAVQRYGTENRQRDVETADFRRVLERDTGRDLERFFYDWTERPGSPLLEVSTDYLAENHQTEVVVRQTQALPPFHFPLRIVLRTSAQAAATVIEMRIREKEQRILVPLNAPPFLVEVDPDQAVLAEIDEKKSRDLWKAQLLHGTNVPARIRAVKHFAETKNPEDAELLAEALNRERFWGVKVEIASIVADRGETTGRDALLRSLCDADARVRRACVDGLAKFASDAQCAAAITKIVQKGDPSYAVESMAIIHAIALGQKDAVAHFNRALETDNPWKCFVLLSSVGQLGSAAVPLLPALERCASESKHSTLRKLAKNAMGIIRVKS